MEEPEFPRESPGEAELWEAYRRTTFEAQTKDGEILVQIRVGEICPELDALLVEQGLDCWVFITAWNPGPQRPGKQVNEERNLALNADLESLQGKHSTFRGVGRGEDPNWEPEESFLVLGVELAEGIRLGQKYRQAAIVAGERGGAARLVDCRTGGGSFAELGGP